MYRRQFFKPARSLTKKYMYYHTSSEVPPYFVIDARIPTCKLDKKVFLLKFCASFHLGGGGLQVNLNSQ